MDGVKSAISRHPLVAFFVLAFGLTWPFMIADAMGSWGLLPFRLTLTGAGIIVVLLMGFGPTFAALIVTSVTSGKAGIRALLSRLFLWRVGIQWYIAAILGTFGLFFVAAQMYTLLGGKLRTVPPLSLGLMLMVTASLLVHGLLNGEELGWRGVALPRLLTNHSALSASLIMGVVWFLFHLPLFFTRGGGVGGDQANTPVLAFLASTLASSVLVTWLYSNTRGSVLFAYLFHAAVNTWPDLFHSVAPDPVMTWLQAALFGLAALGVIAIFGAGRLSHKPASDWPIPIDVSTLQHAA